MDSTNAKPYELTFFNAIFKDKNIVEEDDLKESHVTNGFVTAQKKLDKYFHAKTTHITMIIAPHI